MFHQAHKEKKNTAVGLGDPMNGSRFLVSLHISTMAGLGLLGQNTNTGGGLSIRSSTGAFEIDYADIRNKPEILSASEISNRINSAVHNRNYVYDQRTDVFAMSNIGNVTDSNIPYEDRWSDVTDGPNPFSVTISSGSDQNKILVKGSVAHRFNTNTSLSDAGNDAIRGHFALKRNVDGNVTVLPPKPNEQINPIILAGSDASSAETDRNAVLWKTEFEYIDDPNTTEAVTYTLVVGSEIGSTSFFFNRTIDPNTGSNGAFFERGVSILSAEELN